MIIYSHREGKTRDEEDEAMKKMVIKKIGREWYVIVKNADGSNYTMASFSTKKVAEGVRDHWIRDKFFGEAEKA